MLRLAFVVLCLSALVAVNGVAVTRSQCSFLVSSQLGQPTPILLQPHGNIQFRGSTSSPGTIILNAGDQISFACTGTNNFLLTNGSPYGTATCVSGTTFSMGGTNFEIGQFTCSVVSIYNLFVNHNKIKNIIPNSGQWLLIALLAHALVVIPLFKPDLRPTTDSWKRIRDATPLPCITPSTLNSLCGQMLLDSRPECHGQIGKMVVSLCKLNFNFHPSTEILLLIYS